MPSLLELQQRFADAIFGSTDAADIVSGSTTRARQRIAIYRRTILSNYRKALGASYPVVARLTGAAFFQRAVEAFVESRPSKSGDLNVYGHDFGDFLAAYAPAAELPYLPDVARLEWAIDEAQRAGDAAGQPETVLATLAATAPERLASLRFTLETSCRLIASRYPIFRIWQTNQPNYVGDDHISLDEGGDALLIRRGLDGASIERLAAGDHVWLASLYAGATLGAAIDAAQNADGSFDLGVALREHIAAGTIIAVIDR
jgi:hypothetical protein